MTEAHEPIAFGSWEGLIFWAVFVWVFWPELRLSSKGLGAPRRDQDAGTTNLVFIVNSVTLFAAFIAAFLPHLQMPHPRVAFFVGVAMLVSGSLARRWCWRTLGEYFTAAIKVSSGQEVVDRGPYRLVRHPSYTAGIVVLVGVGVALGNWVSVAVLLVPSCLLYLYRARIEEQALLATLGEPYREYMARTKRFIPFVV